MNIRTQQHGFTLIELMITIAILGILAAIAYPSFETYIQRQRIENTRAIMTKIIHHAEKAYARKGTFCEDKDPSGKCIFDMAEIAKLQDPDSKYTITQNITANSYIITATPKSGVYSANTLANNHLNILYDSTTTNFAICNTVGFGKANRKQDPASGCKVF